MPRRIRTQRSRRAGGGVVRPGEEEEEEEEYYAEWKCQKLYVRGMLSLC